MCQTVDRQMPNNCPWASCGEWCLTRTSGFCPQIHSVVRRNGTDIQLNNCSRVMNTSCAMVSTQGSLHAQRTYVIAGQVTQPLLLVPPPPSMAMAPANFTIIGLPLDAQLNLFTLLPQIDLNRLNKFNCNNGTVCNNIRGVFNCSNGKWNPWSLFWLFVKLPLPFPSRSLQEHVRVLFVPSQTGRTDNQFSQG